MNLKVRSENGGWVEVPILNYKGYQVHDSAGNEYDIYNGTNCRIGFNVPADFDDVITIQFVDFWYWRAGIYVSILSFMVLILVSVLKSIKKKQIQKSLGIG